MSEFDDMLHVFLRRIHEDDPEAIAPSNNVETNYSFLCMFRRTAKGRAQGANLDVRVQNAMNHFTNIEEVRGKRPQFNMVYHYSHARDLMPVTWQYSSMQ
jgi:hypothetical protein